MHRLVCVTMLVLCFNSPAIAQDRSELTSATDATARRALVLDKADARLIHLLKQRETDLGLDDYHVASIEQLLKGWRFYNGQECEFVGLVTGGQPISRSTFAEMCRERRYTARIPVVIGVTRCLSRELTKPDNTRHAAECLMPLTPLRSEGDYDA